MRRIFLALAVSIFAVGTAMAQGAQGTCASQAMSKDGKPLSGAAKTSAIKKCCAERAVSSEGKKLTGAARKSSIQKCESET